MWNNGSNRKFLTKNGFFLLEGLIFLPFFCPNVIGTLDFLMKTFKVVELTPWQAKWSIQRIKPLVGRGYIKCGGNLDHPIFIYIKIWYFLQQNHGFWFCCRKYHNSYKLLFFYGTKLRGTILKWSQRWKSGQYYPFL